MESVCLYFLSDLWSDILVRNYSIKSIGIIVIVLVNEPELIILDQNIGQKIRTKTSQTGPFTNYRSAHLCLEGSFQLGNVIDTGYIACHLFICIYLWICTFFSWIWLNFDEFSGRPPVLERFLFEIKND